MRSAPVEVAFRHRKDRGAALIASLVFLALMTLLGVSALQNTRLQEAMAGNQHSQATAFQAAEAAVRLGEGRALLSDVFRENCSDYSDCVLSKNTDSALGSPASVSWRDDSVLPGNETTFHVRKVADYTSDLGLGANKKGWRYQIFEIVGCSDGLSDLGNDTCGDGDARVTLYSTYQRRLPVK